MSNKQPILNSEPMLYAVDEETPLIHQVVSGGYCVGCGSCAAISGGALTMRRQEDGTYVPGPRPSGDVGSVGGNDLAAACPFSSQCTSEDELSKEFLPDANHHHGELGRYIESHVVHVTSEELRAASSSGGFARWLLRELLQQGHVTHVAHVTNVEGAAPGEELFRYSLTDDANELRQTAKSAYYPVNLEDVIPAIKKVDGQVAITAIPCFAKAIRQLCLQDADLRRKIKIVVGIICGHMKSRGFAELLSWQVGVPPGQLGGADFRQKLPGWPANHKGFSVYDLRSSRWTEPVNTKGLVGGDWGLGLLKNHACEFCDDVLAEVADVAVGDAWLPEYIQDPKGHSIVVIRNRLIQSVLRDGVRRGELKGMDVDANTVAKSQAGGLRHRREGLSYRLWITETRGLWHPPKRVPPDSIRIPKRRKRIYEVRYQLAVESLKAFSRAMAADDLSLFYDGTSKYIKTYDKLHRPWWRRRLSPIKRILTSLLGNLKRRGIA